VVCLIDDRKPPAGAIRKQSTGSLSLSGEHVFTVPGQRRVHSQQDIAAPDSSAGRMSASALMQSDNASARSSEPSSPSFDDMPIEDQLQVFTDRARASGQRAAAATATSKKDKGWGNAPMKPEHRVEELDFEVAKLTARLTDMETMCEQCADYMDQHIGENKL
jgi:hypothetical protein